MALYTPSCWEQHLASASRSGTYRLTHARVFLFLYSCFSCVAGTHAHRSVYLGHKNTFNMYHARVLLQPAVVIVRDSAWYCLWELFYWTGLEKWRFSALKRGAMTQFYACWCVLSLAATISATSSCWLMSIMFSRNNHIDQWWFTWLNIWLIKILWSWCSVWFIKDCDVQFTSNLLAHSKIVSSLKVSSYKMAQNLLLFL